MRLADPSIDKEGPVEKRAQFLERNRLAACRSRQKKKERVKSLETTTEELADRNTNLLAVVAALRREVEQMREAVLNIHADCGCGAIQAINVHISPGQSQSQLQSQQQQQRHIKSAFSIPAQNANLPSYLSSPSPASLECPVSKSSIVEPPTDHVIAVVSSAQPCTMHTFVIDSPIQALSPPRPASDLPLTPNLYESSAEVPDYFSSVSIPSSAFDTPNLIKHLDFSTSLV